MTQRFSNQCPMCAWVPRGRQWQFCDNHEKEQALARRAEWKAIADRQQHDRRDLRSKTRRKPLTDLLEKGPPRRHSKASDEMYFSLVDSLNKEKMANRTIRTALTIQERDLLSERCEVAMHVIGAAAHQMWYRATGYGFSTWLYGVPPTNRGFYLLRPKPYATERNTTLTYDASSSPSTCLSFDGVHLLHLRPQLDDPPNTYLPLGDSDIPPPLYPCTTRLETGLRNLRGRPTLTLNRSLAGIAYTLQRKSSADTRALARSKFARMNGTLVGSITDRTVV